MITKNILIWNFKKEKERTIIESGKEDKYFIEIQKELEWEKREERSGRRIKANENERKRGVIKEEKGRWSGKEKGRE